MLIYAVRVRNVGLDTDIFNADTEILYISYDGHGHVATKRVRKRTRIQTLLTFRITDTDILHYACP
jgi:hypothetical protein